MSQAGKVPEVVWRSRRHAAPKRPIFRLPKSDWAGGHLLQRYFFCSPKRLSVPCEQVKNQAFQLPDLDGKSCWLKVPGSVPGRVWSPLPGTTVPETIKVLRADVLPADVLRLKLELAGKPRVIVTLDGQWATIVSKLNVTVPGVAAAGNWI